MESVKTALKNFAAKVGEKSYRLGLKWLRNLIDRADDWCHAQEVKLRDQAARPAFLAEVDPVASAAREKQFRGRRLSTPLEAGTDQGHRGAIRYCATQHVREEARTPFTSTPRRPRTKIPRLKYDHGEFVRTA